jgi:hypothetical protein
MMFISAALVFTCAASAQTPLPSAVGTPKGASETARFTAHKQKLLDRIQARLQVLQTLQSCVQASNERTAMKVCEQTAHDAMKKHAEN